MHVILQHRTGKIDLGEMFILPERGDQIAIAAAPGRYAERVEIDVRLFERRLGLGWVCVLIPTAEELPSDG